MFARKFRVPRSQKFHHSQVVHSLIFVCKLAPNALPYNRFGFVISKKIDKRATVRNRQKRRVRALLEERQDNPSLGKDLLFILKPLIKSIPREEIITELQKVTCL